MPRRDYRPRLEIRMSPLLPQLLILPRISVHRLLDDLRIRVLERQLHRGPERDAPIPLLRPLEEDRSLLHNLIRPALEHIAARAELKYPALTHRRRHRGLRLDNPARANPIP